jgi:hypothetical protein
MMRRHPFLVSLFAALLVGACIPSTATPSLGATATPPATASASAALPSASDQPSASATAEQPSASSPTATDSATPSAAGASPSGSTGPGSAAACSGTDNNRAFFQTAAAAVKWTVYCAVLPAGWFVDSGSYRGTSGGWVQIAYKGPGGARFELHEGAFCTTPDGCVPPGTDAGTAPFGNLTATLVTVASGGWAVIVDRGKPIAWLAVGTGTDQATFQRFAGALTIVSR